jgi:hypothetical protein
MVPMGLKLNTNVFRDQRNQVGRYTGANHRGMRVPQIDQKHIDQELRRLNEPKS